MCAWRLAQRVPEAEISLFEASSSLGRKILIAGASGLNVAPGLDVSSTTYQGPRHFVEGYDLTKLSPAQQTAFQAVLNYFSIPHWIAFIERLGFRHFFGSSGRYFLEDKKAARFIAAWVQALGRNVTVFKNTVVSNLTATKHAVGTHSEYVLEYKNSENTLAATQSLFDWVVLATGGKSYLPSILKAVSENPIEYALKKQNIPFSKYEPSNIGFEVSWPKSFLNEIGGRTPLKNVLCTSALGSRRGDILITEYGVEGTPIYTIGTPGPLSLDLFPDLSIEQLQYKLSRGSEKRAFLRQAKKTLHLDPVREALLFHCVLDGFANGDGSPINATTLKAFQLPLHAPRPIDEAISTSGGLVFENLGSDFQLQRLPNCYAIGEMLDFDAITGGFWLHACVAQGYFVADQIAEKLLK